MASWQDLDDELNAWDDVGLCAQFWWRDDDAVQVTPALERLLDMQARVKVPLVLAVVPADLDAGLADRLNRQMSVDVVQHGFAHKNHAAAGEKSSEYPEIRDAHEMIRDVVSGWSMMSPFAQRCKIFVPPWNRMSERLHQELSAQGYLGASTFGPRKNSTVSLVNTHMDLIDWRGHRGFAGEKKVLDQVHDHLYGKRCQHHDPTEPTGLLSHHLDHDDACWDFLEKFLHWTQSRQTIEWLPANRLFGT